MDKLAGKKVITTISATEEQLSILDLMALRHEVTRSAMLSRLIVLHADVDVNVCEVAERITGKYCESNVPFEGFLDSAKTWLEQKKISQFHIERIIDEIRRNHEA